MTRTKTREGDAPEVEIAAPDDSKAKGRTFRATLFAWVEADGLWDGGETDTDVRRPVAAWFGCSDGAAGAFKANMRLGRRIEVHGSEAGDKYRHTKTERWEFLRSAGYRFDDQRFADIGATCIEARLDSLLRIDGMGMVNPDGVSFVVLPTRSWALAQHVDTPAVMRHLRAVGCKVPDDTIAARLPALAATGSLFATYLDRQTRCPLPADPRLHTQIMVAAIDAGLAMVGVEKPSYGDAPWGHSAGIRYSEHGTARVGLLPGIAMKAKHEPLELFLAGEVQRYRRVVR